jgi:3-dehydroquinate synthase
MQTISFKIASKNIQGHFGSVKDFLLQFSQTSKPIVLTESKLYPFFSRFLDGYEVIQIEGGEQHKIQATADFVISELMRLNADKSCTIIGMGGGVITDLAGYVAAVYKRGVKLILVPTSLLAMVDASIGGKNGVNIGHHKNMVGTIYQPDQIVFDIELLKTLPENEWENGFAEIIKHAVIADAAMFDWLKNNSLEYFVNDTIALEALVLKNVKLKFSIVQLDEHDRGERKKLNFGHTIGHAIENLYELPHGHAVAIGMVKESILSDKIKGRDASISIQIDELLCRYGLPVTCALNNSDVWHLIQSDKKKNGGSIDLIAVDAIGSSRVERMDMDRFFRFFNETDK